jgi:DNA primase
MFPREVVTEVVAASPIEDIIGAALTLQPAGSGRKKALCPFHQEKTPSFHVNMHRQVFHCFGCGKGGDVLAFVMEHEGLSFMEALQKLADRAGIRLPAATFSDDKAQNQRAKVLEFSKFAAALYTKIYEDPSRGQVARDYVAQRKLKNETLRHFGVGFAPDAWRTLAESGANQHFAADIQEASGLCKRADRGDLYDIFRNRVMFPIRDIAGNVVAFGGRDLGDSPAKYINSPETAVYKKSRVLYGLYEAREALRHEKYAILVEGYFDLIRCFDAGIENVVATCGTALTEGQAQLIRRYVPEVVVVYDGDSAGIKAAMKAAGILIAAGLGVRATALPEGKDPDDFVRDHGGDALRQRIAAAGNFVHFYAEHSKERLGSIEGRTEVAHEIFEILLGLSDELRMDEYVKQVAVELGLNPMACRREFDKHRRQGMQRALAAPAEQANEAELVVEPAMEDCIFLAVLMDNPALLAQAQKDLERVTLPQGPMAEVLTMLLHAGVTDAQAMESEDARRLYTAAAVTDLTVISDPAAQVRKRINRLRYEALRGEAAAVLRAIQEVERGEDAPSRRAQLMVRQIQIEQQIRLARVEL